MNSIHKRRRAGKATCARAVNAGAVVGVVVTQAAIARRRDMSGRFGNHDHTIMRLAILAAVAIIRDARRVMIKGRQRKAGEAGRSCSGMTYQAIHSGCWQGYMGSRLTDRSRCARAIMTGVAFR